MTPLLAHGLRSDRSFERIYRRHVGDVYHYALAVLRNPADAEDVTQTTFLNAYRAYQRGERPRTPQNWLIAIAHNVCRQRFRQASRRPQEVELDENAAEPRAEEDSGPTADDLRRALSHLAFNQRAAIVMRELEGRSYAEIAEILGISLSAVETLIFRGRRALREQLEGSLTCADAERALSLETDGQLPRSERGALRAHLRECKACATLARSQRAQRSAFKALGALPLPASLTSLFGGGGIAIGTKAAAVVATGILAGGISFEGVRHLEPAKPKPVAARVAPAPAHRSVQPVAPAVVPHRSPGVHVAPKKQHGKAYALPPAAADVPKAIVKPKPEHVAPGRARHQHHPARHKRRAATKPHGRAHTTQPAGQREAPPAATTPPGEETRQLPAVTLPPSGCPTSRRRRPAC